ncbi:MAG: methyltransferase domain-containing protein [Alphaproteobacteria bacterium]|nr:methyltransferase domain-containing protein [Alphaproteobacteria bacterium]
MWNDVTDLRDFYASGLGQMAQRMICCAMRIVWPDVTGLRVMGLGFATPYLRLFKGKAERTLAFMPASQGVMPWPEDEPGLVALTDETALPLPDCSIDRLVVIHALESTEQVRALMRELWRVLADGGRLMVVVPNRSGIWARLERTPFGIGRPYTTAQLHFLLRDSLFTPVRKETSLFVPPSRSRMLFRSAPAWEKLGRRWFPTFAGVLVVEAVKQIYAAPLNRQMEREQRQARVAVPGGVPLDSADTPPGHPGG